MESVARLMKTRPILFHGKELLISRMVPKIYTYHGHITSSLAVQLITDEPYGQTDMKLVQESLEKHFQQLGSVLAREWIIPDQTIVFAFDEYVLSHFSRRRSSNRIF